MEAAIPLSYGYTAKVHSETTHNLLEENCGVEDKEEVFQGLKEFIVKENNKLPPLYTLEEEMEQTEAILDDISEKGYYRIYSLDQLFMHLYSRTFPEHPIPQSIAKDMLTHCGLDYHPSIACEWHITYQKDAGKYCSLSCARRWVFMMCDNMNLHDTFGVLPQEGKHLPCAASVCGVLVDVPRTNIMGPLEKTSVNSWCPIPEDEDLGFTGAYSGKEENCDTVRSPWNRKAGMGSSSSASLATLLNSQFPDTASDQDFPALAARKTYKAAAVEPSPLTTFAGIGRGMRPDDIPYLGVPGMGRGKKYRQPKKE
ncbi:protein maelstrom-like isoform X1 [Cherax quadricarinatus]|uniref:protein maelstrom-like isoform X1 n=1 Tax=Cherax quadricarinatus TaxID=27406 RepID=UPI00387ECC6D